MDRQLVVSELRAIYAVVLKDLQAYYTKPPNLSWGIMFPITLALIFLLVRPLDVATLAPGLIGLSILFGTTSMAAIDITFERRTGTLDRLIQAPISVLGLVLAKTLAATVFGIMMAMTMLVLVEIVLGFFAINWLAFTASVFFSSLTCSAFGVLIAVGVREVFEAQTFLNLFRFPMVFLSGFLLPLSTLPPPLLPISLALPLTYSLELLRYSLTGTTSLINVQLASLVLVTYFSTLYAAAVLMLRSRFR
jgi:ABC-2 type transport system permease protein